MKTILWFSVILFSFGSARSQDKIPAISFTHLDGDFYVFQSWIMFGGSPVACNGLYVVTSKGVVLINTPTDEEQTSHLLDSI